MQNNDENSSLETQFKTFFMKDFATKNELCIFLHKKSGLTTKN